MTDGPEDVERARNPCQVVFDTPTASSQDFHPVADDSTLASSP